MWALDLTTGTVKYGWPVTLQGEYQGKPFDGGQLTQRGALTKVDGRLYVPFSSRCDIGEWHGWVMGVDTRNPSNTQRVFSPAPDASGGGIWGSAGLATDRDGNLYAVIGNGDYNLEQGGHSVTEAIVRLVAKDEPDGVWSRRDLDRGVPGHLQDEASLLREILVGQCDRRLLPVDADLRNGGEARNEQEVGARGPGLDREGDLSRTHARIDDRAGRV